MSLYPPPVTLDEFKRYLNDDSSDTTMLGFYTACLEAATESVYTYLGRDYSSAAARTDIFWGDGTNRHRLRYPAGAIVSWQYLDTDGTPTVGDHTKLHLFENGELIIGDDITFERGYEHRIAYTLPLGLTAPKTVAQVILEHAARIYEESKRGTGILVIESEWQTNARGAHYRTIDERHRRMLAPYRKLI
jgi:hypothetical protein